MSEVGPSTSEHGPVRQCPICERRTHLELCPEHAIGTLLLDPPSSTPNGLREGSLIAGRYRILSALGRGGFGTVYKALHTGTAQHVAIKTLSSVLYADSITLKRFFQEAHVTASLRHPNTIRVFDFGQDDSGVVYLVMELLTGVTLKQELKMRQSEGRVFTEREAIEIGVQVTRSLSEAHAAKLVHRDLKPENIFLHDVVDGEDPIVKVLDFGIAKLSTSSLTLASDSGMPGTPAYMSPEQVTRGEIDGRSDLYSLAAVLYKLVTGRVPFKGNDVLQTLYQHVHEPVPDIRVHAKTPLSNGFAAIIESALSKDPRERPQTAKEMRDRLLLCLGNTANTPTPQRLTRDAPAPGNPEIDAIFARPFEEIGISGFARTDSESAGAIQTRASRIDGRSPPNGGALVLIGALVVLLMAGVGAGTALWVVNRAAGAEPSAAPAAPVPAEASAEVHPEMRPEIRRESSPEGSPEAPLPAIEKVRAADVDRSARPTPSPELPVDVRRMDPKDTANPSETKKVRAPSDRGRTIPQRRKTARPTQNNSSTEDVLDVKI